MTRRRGLGFLLLVPVLLAFKAAPRGPGGDHDRPPPSRPSATPSPSAGEPENFVECSVSDEGVIRAAVSDKQFRHFDSGALLDDRRSLWIGETVFLSESGDLALVPEGTGDEASFRLLRYDHGPQGRVDIPGTPILPRRPEFFYVLSPGHGRVGGKEPAAPGLYSFDLDGNARGSLAGQFTAVAASLTGELILVREASGAHALVSDRGRVLWRRGLQENPGTWNREDAPNAAVLENGNCVIAGASPDGQGGGAELIDAAGRLLKFSTLDVPVRAVSENGRYLAARRGPRGVEVFDFLAGDRLRFEYRVVPVAEGYDIHDFEVNDYGWLAVVDSGGRLLIYNATGDLASQPELGFPPGHLASHASGRMLELLGANGLASVEWFTGRVVDRRPAETF